MRYFKNENNNVLGIDVGQDHLIKASWAELTAEEVDALLNPEPEPPTIAEQIAAIEASVTPRNLRGAALGDQFSIDKIQAVEDEIDALREQLGR
jgi:hypothetical protein